MGFEVPPISITTHTPKTYHGPPLHHPCQHFCASLPEAGQKACPQHQAVRECLCPHAPQWCANATKEPAPFPNDGSDVQHVSFCTDSQVTSSHHPTFECLLRMHFNGTNRGDVIYGVKMPSYDSPDIWKLSVKEKRELYGKHRVPVGSKGPEGGENEGWMKYNQFMSSHH